MPTRNNKKSELGTPLRVISIGGWGSNWKIKAEKIPGSKRYTISRNRNTTDKKKYSKVPLKVIVVGGWGSNWKIRRETIPRSIRYPLSGNKNSSFYLKKKMKTI